MFTVGLLKRFKVSEMSFLLIQLPLLIQLLLSMLFTVTADMVLEEFFLGSE